LQTQKTHIFLRKKLKNFFKKHLKFAMAYGIIIKHDCDRYAMKREVAAKMGRFFRGVCPILNRAKNYECAEFHRDNAAFADAVRIGML